MVIIRKFMPALLIGLVLIASGCSSSQDYDNPSKVNNTTKDVNKETFVNTFSVGEKASTGNMAVKLNSVNYVNKIPVTSSYYNSKASSGKDYVLVDITVYNQQKNKSVTVSNILTAEVQDGEGYTYEPSIYSASALEKGFTSGEILPGGKERGRIAFEVPENVSNLKFKYKFSLFGSSTAVYELPDKETRYSLEFAEKPKPKASIEIVSVQSSWTNYDSQYISDSGTISNVEVKIENTGEISFMPEVGITISHDSSEIYSSDDAVTFFSELAAGKSSTEDISLYQSINSTGEYVFTAEIRNKETNKVLDQDSYSKTIN
ncbi:MAG: DUF4352 domain-containing protein [Candidatus Nanohalobium sp.]